MRLGHDFVLDLCVSLPTICFFLLQTKMIMIDLLQVFFVCNGPAIEYVDDVYMPKGDDTSLLVSAPGRDMGTGLLVGRRQ